MKHKKDNVENAGKKKSLDGLSNEGVKWYVRNDITHGKKNGCNSSGTKRQ